MAAKKKISPSMPKGDANAARYYKALAKFKETRSADTAARAATGRGINSGASAKRKVASQATDAVSRRYKSTASEWNGSGGKNVLDKVTGITRKKYSDSSLAGKPVHYTVSDPKTEKKLLGKTKNYGKSQTKAQQKLKNLYGK